MSCNDISDKLLLQIWTMLTLLQIKHARSWMTKMLKKLDITNYRSSIVESSKLGILLPDKKYRINSIYEFKAVYVILYNLQPTRKF